MRSGIPMDAIDRMSLERYLTVLQAAAKRRDAHTEKETMVGSSGKKNVVTLRRGTIDEVW